MKDLIAIIFGLCCIFMLIDLCGFESNHSRDYVVADVRKITFATTRREAYMMDITHRVTYSSLTGLISGDRNDKESFEITEDGASAIHPGMNLTAADIEVLRGRSNLGRIWDWLKKPR